MDTTTHEVEVCARCKKNPVAPPRITVSGKEIKRARCEGCLNYARKWQQKNTTKRLKAKKCITCGEPTEGSRCDRCTGHKARNYFETRAIAS